jgi:hypothetical protein
MRLAMTVVVFEVRAPGLEGTVVLVLDLPATAGRHDQEEGIIMRNEL